MAKAAPRNPSARMKATRRKVAAMVKGGRQIAAQQASDKVAKRANARSIARVGHRMVGTASVRNRLSPIKIKQAIKSNAPKAAYVVNKTRVLSKLAGRPERQQSRSYRHHTQRIARIKTRLAERQAGWKARYERNEMRAAAKVARSQRVGTTQAAVRDKFPMLRSKSHSPVARKAAALQIKAHRSKNPKAKGIASAAGKGIPHFEGSLSKGKLSLKKAIAPGTSLAGKRVRYLKLSRHAGKSSVKHLNPPKVRLPVGRAIPPKGLARPIPTGKVGSRGPGLKTNLLKGRGLSHAASVGAKLRARKLGRGLKSAASSAFHAPTNLTSKLGAKAATAIAGKRLSARLKG